jgi:hypothetical protein
MRDPGIQRVWPHCGGVLSTASCAGLQFFQIVFWLLPLFAAPLVGSTLVGIRLTRGWARG